MATASFTTAKGAKISIEYIKAKGPAVYVTMNGKELFETCEIKNDSTIGHHLVFRFGTTDKLGNTIKITEAKCPIPAADLRKIEEVFEEMDRDTNERIAKYNRSALGHYDALMADMDRAGSDH